MGTLAIKNKLAFYLVIDNAIQVDFVVGGLSSFLLIESTNSFVPVARLKFTDLTGLVLDNYDKLYTGDLVYNLGHAGDSGKNGVKQYNHYIFTQKPTELFTPVSTSSVAFDITTWAELGPTLTYGDHVRSFGEVSAADAITALCTEEGIATRMIEPGSDKQFYIQGQWTNAQFIRYLATKAVSKENGQRGYLYFTDREGKLTFASPKYVYEQNKASAVKLAFASNPKYYAEHKDTTVLSWAFESNAQLFFSSTSYGRVFKYFDPSEYKYDEVLKTAANEVSAFSITTFALLNTKFGDYSLSEPLGRKIVDEVTLNTRSMSSLFDLTVLINYNDDVRLGSVVNFQMHLEKGISSASSRMVLDVISADWVVCKIAHRVDAESKEYFMKLSLTRSGIGQKAAQNLMK